MSDTLKSGEVLTTNQFIRSKSGKYVAIMEAENNLVLYMKTDDKGTA